MPHINEITASLSTKAEAVEAIGVTAGPNLEILVGVQIVVPVICPKSAKHTEKDVFTATRKDISVIQSIQSLLDRT